MIKDTDQMALTAEALLEHIGHALIVERYGLDCYTYFKTVGAALECETCGQRLTLEWTGGDN